jgi:hypothetical protein
MMVERKLVNGGQTPVDVDGASAIAGIAAREAGRGLSGGEYPRCAPEDACS